MRRWLSILLLVFLPFQFCWAAVATYCEHESSAQEMHFGHHENEHKHEQITVQADEDASSKTAALTLDLNDGHTHCQCMIDFTTPIEMPVSIDASRLADRTAASLAALALSPPERPQWPHHA